MSQDVTRAHVNSINIAKGEVVATDGHRLHVAEFDTKEPFELLMPSLFIAALKSLDAGTWRLGFDTSRIVVESETQRVCCLRGDGTFPPYQQVIPKGNATCSARINRLEALDKIGSASKGMRSENDRGRSLKLSVVGDTMRIASSNSEMAAGSVEATACDANGKPAEFSGTGVNPEYIVDALGMFDCDHVNIDFRGELDPIVVRSGADDDRDVAVVMPMRV